MHFAVIVAGGTGTRMGANVPKQFLELKNKPILFWTIEKFIVSGLFRKIVVSLLESHIEYFYSIAENFFGKSDLEKIKVVSGGKTRAESVENALKFIQNNLNPSGKSIVAIHDGVRPLLNQKLIQTAIAECKNQGNSLACLPIKYTLRQKIEDLTQYVDRANFLEVQTPQTFYFKNIFRYYSERPNDNFTDDAGLAEYFGEKIHVIDGLEENIKITRPFDLLLAETFIESQTEK